jgi:PAS domain S-box-containing protein
MEKAKILIVEDEAIIAMELESQLQSLGYEVTSIVDTGDDAIKKAEIDKPDLILMDIRIKGEMDGIEAAEIIRNKFGIPVIFSTAYLDHERIERAKITMPFGYVLKPIQERDLRVTLEMALYVAKIDAERKRVEDELARQKAELQTIFDSVPALVFYKDKNDKFVNVNERFAGSFGLSKEEIIGKTASELSPVADKSYLEDDLLVINAGKPKIGITEPFETQEGIRWAQTDKIPYRNEKGEIVGIIGFAIDITERKHAEETIKESEKQYKELADLLPQVIFEMDEKGILTFVNQFAYEMFEYTEEEFKKGLNALQMLVPEEQERAMNNISKILNGEMIGGNEYMAQKKDGIKFPIILHASRIMRRSVPVGLRGIIINISGLKKT